MNDVQSAVQPDLPPNRSQPAQRTPRALLGLVAVVALLSLSGCSTLNIFANKLDLEKNWNAEQYYSKARDELDSGNFSGAVKTYEALEAKFPFGKYAQQAQIETAYAYYRDNDFAQATSAVERFIKLHPNHPNLDYVLFLKGLIGFRVDLGLFSFLADQDLAERDAKATRESFDNFRELIERFPDSRYAVDARQRMVYLVDALARGETKIAQYYLSRGAYVAAVSRAQNVLTRYPQASTRASALEVMRVSYQRMEAKDLSEDIARVIEKNHPQTAATQNRSWWQFWK